MTLIEYCTEQFINTEFSEVTRYRMKRCNVFGGAEAL